MISMSEAQRQSRTVSDSPWVMTDVSDALSVAVNLGLSSKEGHTCINHCVAEQ